MHGKQPDVVFKLDTHCFAAFMLQSIAQATKAGILYRLCHASHLPAVLQAMASKDDGVVFYNRDGPGRSPTLQATGFGFFLDCLAVVIMH